MGEGARSGLEAAGGWNPSCLPLVLGSPPDPPLPSLRRLIRTAAGAAAGAKTSAASPAPAQPAACSDQPRTGVGGVDGREMDELRCRAAAAALGVGGSGGISTGSSFASRDKVRCSCSA